MLRAADVEMDWRVQASGSVPALRGAGALELVRWLQEALSNALRHGQPTRLIVATQWADGAGAEVDEAQAHSLVLWFIDDGRGLPELLRPGQGLRSLEARAKRLGAAMSLTSPAPGGWLEAGHGTALGLRLALR
jgi:signal transduction histidine kinase